MPIGLVSIYVDDQDQAERFYTQVLGLQVKTSAPYTDTERWLSVAAPQDPDGVEVVFVKEPSRMPYGGIDAVFDDTCGNLLDLHQD